VLIEFVFGPDIGTIYFAMFAGVREIDGREVEGEKVIARRLPIHSPLGWTLPAGANVIVRAAQYCQHHHVAHTAAYMAIRL
jgi:hypothetical protein